jgi:Ankyrin repeats (3 copies)
MHDMVDLHFFDLLDLNPYRQETVNDDAFCDAIAEDGAVLCSKKYQFVDSFGGDWLYPLHVICALGASLDTVKACYKAYPDAIMHHSVSIGGPIHYACLFGASLEVVVYLAKKDHNALLQANIAEGKTPLHLACSNTDSNPHRHDVVCFLTERAPQAAEKMDNLGFTPLNLLCNTLNDNESDAKVFAVVEDLTEVCPQAGIMRAKDGTWPLWNALDARHRIHADHSAICKDLIVSNPESAKLTYLTEDEEENRQPGSTVLHRAMAMESSLSIVKDLLRAFPEACTMEDSQGRIPLMYALTELEAPTLAVIQALVHRCPEVVDMTYRDETPHQIAEQLRLHPEIVSFLNPYEE